MIEIGYVAEVTAKNIVIKLNNAQTQDIVYQDGVAYEMPKINQYIKIHYLDIEIVAQIESESIVEKINGNTENSILVDKDNQFERTLYAKLIGYFSEDSFYIGPKFSPVVFNIVSLINENELDSIINIGNTKLANSISIGKSIISNKNLDIPLDKFFNAHLAIFGNTGSGKSNTLTKLYTELFKNFSTNSSKFIFIDFNGEYEGTEVFSDKKSITKCSTYVEDANKIKLDEKMFKDVDILSVLYNATEKTQKPFLKKVINKWDLENDSIDDYIFNCFKSVFNLNDDLDANVKSLIERIIIHINELQNTNYEVNDEIKYNATRNYFYVNGNGNGNAHNCKISSDCHSPFYFNNILIKSNGDFIKISDIQLSNLNKFDELSLRLELQLLSQIVHKNDRYDFINPLINSVNGTNQSLKKVFEYVSINNTEVENNGDNNIFVYSLKECNQEMKKIIPLIIAKNEYFILKNDENVKSTHFIIDEAHNILSEQSKREGESWKDYRLETFEEIIKEGRKFGFYITLSSQRPSDISSTLVSQMHNYLIHKLVNDRDLQMVRNVVSTLSEKENAFIPQMGQGMCVVSGTRFSIPQIIQVDKLGDSERPNSDDIILDWEKLNPQKSTEENVREGSGIEC